MSKRSVSQVILLSFGIIGMALSAIFFLLYLTYIFSSSNSWPTFTDSYISGLVLLSALFFFLVNYLVFSAGLKGKNILLVQVIMIIAAILLLPIPISLLPENIISSIPSFLLIPRSNILWALLLWLIPVSILIALFRVKKEGIAQGRYRVIQRDEILDMIHSGSNPSKPDIAFNILRFIVFILLINVVVNLVLRANGINAFSFFFFI